jgi:hypothetical protein
MRLDAGRMIGLVFAEASREGGCVNKRIGSLFFANGPDDRIPQEGDSGTTLRETQELAARNLGRGQILTLLRQIS